MKLTRRELGLLAPTVASGDEGLRDMVQRCSAGALAAGDCSDRKAGGKTASATTF